MRLPADGRADQREREFTAYLVVGDGDAAQRLARRAVSDAALADLLQHRLPAPPARGPARAPGLPARQVAFWWWWEALPERDRAAVALQVRHAWWSPRAERLLDEAAEVLGCPTPHAPAAVATALERRLCGYLSEPPSATQSARRATAGALMRLVVVACSAAVAIGGGLVLLTPEQPIPHPVEARLLPRPLARPIPNYEHLAAVRGAQWDLPRRGSQTGASGPSPPR